MSVEHRKTAGAVTENLYVTRSSSPLRPPLLEDMGFSRGQSLTHMENGSERARVLLMVPPYTRIKRRAPESLGFWPEQTKRVGTPIGLLRLGTATQNAGYSVKVIDAAAEGFENETLLVPEMGMYRYGLADEEITKRIMDFRPHVIGITADYTCQWGNVRALADLMKRIDSKIVVVLGGAHATLDYKNALLDSAADYVVMGEGDRTFVELIKMLENREDNRQIRGIAFRENDFIRVTEERPFVSHLSELGVINYDLANLDLYSGPVHSGGKRQRDYGRCTCLFTSVGCNTRCRFCTIPIVNGPFRALDAEILDSQLRHLIVRGVSEVILEDDNLFHDPLWTLKVCELLKKHDVAWMEEGGLALYALIALHLGKQAAGVLGSEYKKPLFERIRKAIEDGVTAAQVIKAMAESGCYSVYLAVESANRNSLQISGKPEANTLAEITLEIIRLFKKHGIKVTGGFMLGFAGPDSTGGAFAESEEDVMNTFAYAKMLMDEGMDFANPFIVTPLPGTPLGEWQMQFVRRDYDFFSHELGVMDLPSLTAKRLEVLRARMLLEINGETKVAEMLRTGSWPV
ncbi:MAG: radical SAM protein [Candidatus ainarchaeum sp.]|nr:radical SAM protein [Candidatus ainarchaeum sp.]